MHTEQQKFTIHTEH